MASDRHWRCSIPGERRYPEKQALPRPSHTVTSSTQRATPPTDSNGGVPAPAVTEPERCLSLSARVTGDQSFHLALESGPDATLSTTTPQPNGVIAMNSTRNWSLQGILSQGSNFRAADRVSALSTTLHEAIDHHEREGLPLVIEDLHKRRQWPHHIFTLDQFCSGTPHGMFVC